MLLDTDVGRYGCTIRERSGLCSRALVVANAPASRPRAPMPHSKYIDQIAIALSAVCIVHCLAVPVLVAVLPIAAVTFAAGSHFHELMLWVVVPTSLAGFVFGVRVHRRFGIALVGVVGMSLVAIAALIGHEAWVHWAELGVSILGSLILAAAHWQNFKQVRLCHQHGHEHG